MIAHKKDTITALATPPGRSGVALIRVSGPQAFNLLQRLIPKVKKIVSHKVQYAKIYSPDDKMIDEAMIWAMRGPKTYTGEDVVEISTHGNPVVIHRILNALLKAGARMAERGEFTKRAFFSGKIDLTQAEAIAQLVAANTTEAAEAALLHLEGALAKAIKEQRKTLLELLARMEAGVDYPEELGELPVKTIKKTLTKAQQKIDSLLKTNRQGKLLSEGLKVVIAGAPNVGKSSILNSLLGESKSIVTEIPGTTRDAIEDVLTLEGMPLRIIDTAGLRPDPDVVEKIGIEKTLAHVDTADLVLFVLDATRRQNSKETKVLEKVRANNIPVIVVNNKIDLLKKKPQTTSASGRVFISAKTGQGLKALEKSLLKKAGWTRQKETSSPIIMETRQKEKLREAESALLRMSGALQKGEAQDILTIDLKAAIIALGEITGEEVSEEVITHIFDNFCVGK